ncbi:MAG: phage shock protein C [Enterobacterales bacterium]|jgi:phage shock protein C
MNSDYEPPVNPKRELYRDPSRGKICGVCVGVADYFGLEVWVVRIIAVTALLFFQFPILIAYFVGYFVLEPRPGTAKYDKIKSMKKQFHNDSYTDKANSKSSDRQSASVQQVWKKGRVPAQRLKTLNSRFKSLENRLQNMETYVTSKQFELRKEFEELSSK